MKLVDKKGDTPEEALVNEILVTNLKASNISLDLKDFDTDAQKTFLEKFKMEASKKMYKDADNKYSVEVKQSPQLLVELNPVLVKRITKTQNLVANLTVTYGTEENETKTYSTSNDKDVEELKASGISFSVYSKMLEKGDEVIDASKITDAENKLNTFFTKEGLEMGVAKTSLQESGGDSEIKPIAEFGLVTLDGTSFNKDFVLGEVKSSMNIPKARDSHGTGELDVEQEKWVSENWISFVGYSFGEKLKDKVLFIPTINLIHTAETTQSVPAGTPGK